MKFAGRQVIREMQKMRSKTRCKYCDTFFIDVDAYVLHLEEVHGDMIPEDMDGWQYYYYLKTGKMNGSCIICKKKTRWNTSTHKYNRFCDNPKCKEIYREIFKKRMIGKYGKVSLLNDPEQQKKMLANRKISGVYRWSKDFHVEIPYTGSYEKKFLEFLDLDLNFDATDIIAPSPHTYYYQYEGETHFYIPDFFIPSLNLEVEIKDGGDNPNMHEKIQAVDKVKEKLKDDVMRSNKNTFNYIKIENMNHLKFLNYLNVAKEKFQNGETEKIFMP
jgi:hypothetical protein